MISEWLSRLRFLLKGKPGLEVDEELQFHLERQTQANMAAGLSSGEARRQAAIAFGGLERAREQCLEQRPAWFLEPLLRDLRYGVRGLRRNPGFATVAILTLALAIGANTTVFSLLDQALLRALPVSDPSQLVVLSFAGASPGHTRSDGGDRPGHRYYFSYPMYLALRDQSTVCNGLIASASVTVGVIWSNHAETVPAELVTGNYFQTLGVRPRLGRLLVAGDETSEGSNPVAVLSFDYWKTHLSESPVVGKTLLVNGTPFTIVGVASPGFQSMVWGHVPDLYVPLTMQHIVIPEWTLLRDQQFYWLNLVGRLRTNGTPAQAATALNPLFHSLRAAEFTFLPDQSAKARGEFVSDSHLNVDAGAQGFSPLREDVRMPLTIIMGMLVLVVGMAIVNVASLLLVRAAGRGREFALRYALGATNGQVFRQLLAEGMLLGVGGVGIGLILAPQVLRVLIRWTAQRSSHSVFVPTLDWRVLWFTIAATLLASLLFSLAPAVQFWNPRLTEALKRPADARTGGTLRFGRTCARLQIGFSLLLIVAAGLFVRTIQNLRNVNAGFETDHLLAFNLAPGLAGYAPSQIAPVEQRALEAIAILPGVRAVGATNDPDLADNNVIGGVVVAGYTPKPDEEFDVEVPWVSDGYLQALRIPLLAGRYFAAADSATAQKVAIVNESLARHFFGSVPAALGHHISRPNRPVTDAVIVGVVGDARHTTVRDPAIPTSYTLFAQAERPCALTFYVRTWQAPATSAHTIGAAIANIDSKLMVSDLSTMNDEIDGSMLAERTIALLSTIFGILATLLAGIGLYGILAYWTVQRTREIGIRMALGAERRTVIGGIVREAMMLAGSAIAVAVPLAMLASQALRSQLYGVSTSDAGVYGTGIMIIGLLAVLAGYIPARRAAAVDPAHALRTD
jgi:predicted permease